MSLVSLPPLGKTLLIAASVLMIATGAGASTSAERHQIISAAEAKLAEGRRDDAVRLLSEAAARLESVELLLRLAKVQAGGSDSAGALDTLKRARTLAPNSEDVLSAQAQVSLTARAPIAAVQALGPLTRMCPTVASYSYLHGVALLQAGDAVGATEALERATKLDPEHVLSLTALGLAHNARKRYTEARGVLSRSLELQPESAEALGALAEAEEGSGDFDAAQRHAQRALERDPANAMAHLVLGMVRMREQKYDQARAAFEKAVANPEVVSPKAHYQLSLALERLGETAAATKQRELYKQSLGRLEAHLEELRKATGERRSETPR